MTTSTTRQVHGAQLHIDQNPRASEQLVERIWQRLGIAEEMRMFDDLERDDDRRTR